ncbi:uncharacterized protein MYCFIDRAFT_173206 [Pseudocercospora fijiensis CIRAD86]|uniref:Uncharacterized protein n=1 Tax=Pseudocercospora fijiensis (strain CIRAD86) TaxID=383855 RepID=M3AHU7_PSEFD|nr:uncharacterized protein MYCFIDRAFT_173206 [Pseudocercospora fijiensis CIRAD86]EME84166.1 hypothetical protein MYCFIDRAFT_173206 [Pseudocercospora fijiensis CIRAD86]
MAAYQFLSASLARARNRATSSRERREETRMFNGPVRPLIAGGGLVCALCAYTTDSDEDILHLADRASTGRHMRSTSVQCRSGNKRKHVRLRPGICKSIICLKAMSQAQSPDFHAASDITHVIMESPSEEPERTSSDHSNHHPRASKDSCREEVDSMQSLLQMTSEKVVRNLFDYYEFKNWLDGPKIDLFLRLGILDMGNNNVCVFGDREGCFRPPSNYDSLCKAFQAFYFYAEDPLYEELHFRLALLYKNTACDRHRMTIETCKTMAEERFSKLESWRKEQLKPPGELSDDQDDIVPAVPNDRWSKIPRMFSAPELTRSRKVRKARPEFGTRVSEESDSSPENVPSTHPAPVRRALSTSSAGSVRVDSIIRASGEESDRNKELQQTQEALEGIPKPTQAPTLLYGVRVEQTNGKENRRSVLQGFRDWRSKRKENRTSRIY